MSRLRAGISVSRPAQRRQHPLGVGGKQLHEWLFALPSWREPHGRGRRTPGTAGGARALGSGERLLDGLDPEAIRLELTDVVAAPGVTHLTHRVVR